MAVIVQIIWGRGEWTTPEPTTRCQKHARLAMIDLLPGEIHLPGSR